MGQHSVARFYLRPWTQNGELFYLNLKSGKIRRCGVRGVANEPLFYRLHELTAAEVELLRNALIEPFQEPMRTIQQRFLDMHLIPHKLKARAKGTHLDSSLRASLDEIIANLAESYHSKVESCLKPFIVSMLKGNTSFFLEADKAAAFLYAISVQFTRTNKVKQAMNLRLVGKYADCNPERVWSVASHLLAAAAGRSLYRDRQQFKLLVLDNNSGTPFITGDQPIINLDAPNSKEPPEKLEYFYPLSPTKAMLLLEASNPIKTEAISPIAANWYNILIAQNSHEQLFSDSEDYLRVISQLRHVA